MGDFEDIENAPEADRPFLKALILGRLGLRPGALVIHDGPYWLSIMEGVVPDGPSVVVNLRVNRGPRHGREVTPPDLNPVRIVNPPLLVRDPHGNILRLDEDGNSVGVFRFDPRAALFEVLAGLKWRP